MQFVSTNGHQKSWTLTITAHVGTCQVCNFGAEATAKATKTSQICIFDDDLSSMTSLLKPLIYTSSSMVDDKLLAAQQQK